MKLLFVLPLLLLVFACETPKSAFQLASFELNVSMECIQNAMPGSSQEAYVIINATPQDSVIQDNVRISRLIVTGSTGSYVTSFFDEQKAIGKGELIYKNVARKLDPSIGGPFDFKITFEYDCGIIKTYDIKDVKLQTVH